MQTTFWLVVLGVFLAGYLVLEGADFGAGVFLAVHGRRDEAGRDLTVRAIAPFFLANEVWLVAAIGVVVGAFPALDSTVVARLYPAFGLILVAWLVRDAGLWFRRHGGAAWRWRWDVAIAVASALLPFGWGVVIGDIAAPGGAVFGLGPVLCGLALAGFCVLHGTAYLGLRLGPTVGLRRIGIVLSLPVCGAVVLAGVVLAMTGVHWPLWVLGAAMVVVALAIRFTGALIGTSAVLLGVVPLAVLPGFPAVPTDTATLGVMTPLFLAVLPVMIAGQAGMWWLNRRTAGAGSYF